MVLVARTLENLENVANDIRAIRGNGGTAHVYPCDLSDMDAIAVMADQVLGDLGGVDILINNAGRSIRRSLGCPMTGSTITSERCSSTTSARSS